MKVEPVHRAGQLARGWLGEHTASIDWCEDNYALSNYIAEFYNTLSNIPFILLGLHGAYNSLHLPHAGRYALLHAMLAIIGVGSFIFHLTLKWHAQVMLDELPMVFAASHALYIMLVDDSPQSSKSAQIRLKLLMLLLPITVSSVYLAYPDPLLHQVCYAAIMITTTILVQNAYKSPKLTPSIVQQAKQLNVAGSLLFIAGFAIWNIDNIYCDSLTVWRNQVSEYVGWISQGHAWWHLLTGLGASRIATGLTYLRLSLNNPGAYEVSYSLGMPYITPARKVEWNGSPPVRINGKANGLASRPRQRVRVQS